MSLRAVVGISETRNMSGWRDSRFYARQWPMTRGDGDAFDAEHRAGGVLVQSMVMNTVKQQE